MTGRKSGLDTRVADQFVANLSTLTEDDWCFIYEYAQLIAARRGGQASGFVAALLTAVWRKRPGSSSSLGRRLKEYRQRAQAVASEFYPTGLEFGQSEYITMAVGNAVQALLLRKLGILKPEELRRFYGPFSELLPVESLEREIWEREIWD